MPEYQHRSVIKLSELYEKHKDEIGKGAGMMGLLWKALGPSVPELLVALDSDEKLLGKIKAFLQTVLETFEEDTNNEEWKLRIREKEEDSAERV